MTTLNKKNKKEQSIQPASDRSRQAKTSFTNHHTASEKGKIDKAHMPKILLPSIWKSLYFAYPKGFFYTTFLYKDPKYALRNLTFVLRSCQVTVSIMLIPVLAVVWPKYSSSFGAEDIRISFFVVSAALVVMTVARVVLSRIVEFKKFSHIPGPKPSFLYGNYKDLCKTGWGDRHHTLEDMQHEFGPVFRLHMPLFKRPFVYCNFVPHALQSRKLDALRPSKTMSPGSIMALPLGNRHSRNRHHLSKMKSNNHFRTMLKDIDGVSKGLAERMAKEEDGSLNSKLLEWALDSMFIYLYNTHPESSEKKQEIITAVDMFTSEISHRTNEPMWMWFSSWKRIREWTAGFSYLLSIAEDFYNGDSSASHPLPTFMKSHGLKQWEAVDELTIMLAGSFESISHTIAQCLIMLSKDAYRQDKAAQEAREILNEVGDGPILKEDVDKCKYIQHCIYEALRLHPTVPFSARKSTVDYTITLLDGQAISVPGNSYLTYFKTTVGKNEEVFPDAKMFKPERYEGMKTRSEKHMKFLPFGTGPRQCWGQLIAEIQMTQLLIRLLGELEFFSVNCWGEGKDNKTSIAAVSIAAPGIDSVNFIRRENNSDGRE